MRIAIDARALTWAGIGRFTQNLLKNLSPLVGSHEFTVLLRAADQARFAAFHKQYLSPQFTTHLVEGSYYSWAEQTRLLWQLNRLNVDVFHFTHFNVPLFFHRPFVVTIHDVTRFIFPGQKRQDLKQQLAYEYVFAKTIGRARDVVYVSETTHHDVRQLPLAINGRESIIKEAVDERFFTPITDASRQKVRMLLGTADPYLLYVGVWMNHKNLARLIEAFSKVTQHYPTLKLVMTGKPVPGYSNMVKIAQKFKVADQVIFLGFIPDELLPALYAGATCCTFPSLYEGFGLPPLEAMAVGCPVIASNVSSCPEVLGEAALYVNPEYVPDIVDKMHQVIDNQGLRQTLINLGSRQARQLSWAHSAKRYLNTYLSR